MHRCSTASCANWAAAGRPIKTPRDPELVTALAVARADLDDTGGEIAEVRERLYSERRRPRPPHAEVAVDPDTYRRLRASFQDTE